MVSLVLAAVLILAVADASAPRPDRQGGRAAHRDSGLAGPGGGGSPAASQAISVNTTLPAVEDLSLTTDYIGTVKAAESVNVYPKSSGTVTAVYFEAGQQVNAGDLLFTVDSTDEELALERAKVTYDQTLRNIDVEESGSGNALTILNYESAIETARQSYERARDNLDLASDDDFDMSEFRKVRKRWKDATKAYRPGSDRRNMVRASRSRGRLLRASRRLHRLSGLCDLV